MLSVFSYTILVLQLVPRETFNLIAMKNVKFKFRVANNTNNYYATSLKAISGFCRKNDFVLIDYYSYIPCTFENKTAKRCGWGVYGLINNF